MGVQSESLNAPTMAELQKKFKEAAREARRLGLKPDFNFDKARVKETKGGFEILFRAST